MITSRTRLRVGLCFTLFISALALGACESVGDQIPEDVAELCPVPQGHNLNAAFSQVRNSLLVHKGQCAPMFDTYWQRLLKIAEGDPEVENKRLFSDFLVAVSGEGIISEKQAQNLYNRYFNIKFVSLIGDYSICSQACPTRTAMMADMSQELAHKEQGLLKIGTDRSSYQRADQLLKETELVLEATCASCSALR